MDWLDDKEVMRSASSALVASLLAVASSLVMAAAPAGAATLTFASPTLTYSGTDAGESATVESISSTGVKFFNMVSGQIAAPLPAGCSATNVASNGTQIVTCTIAGLDRIAVDLGGGNDTLIATGLSKASEIHGGDGQDSITGGSQADAIYGEGAVDTIMSGPAVDSIFVRDGLADSVDCGGSIDQLQGDTVDVYKGCEATDLSADLVPDADGDGFKPPADCDDTRADVNPGAYDVPSDGIDQNCDGKDAFVATNTGGSGTGTGTGSGSGTGAPVATTPVVATPTTTTKTATPTAPAAKTTPAATTPTPVPTAAATAATASGTPRVTAVPVVTFRVLRAKRYTRATKATVAGVPAGATVRIRCKGAGCPARRYKKLFKTGAEHLVVRSVFDLARLRAGARVEVRVTLPGAIGRSVRYRINARSAPDTEVRCLAAGTGLPIAC